MDKAEQPTITQADRDAAAAYWKASMIGSSMTQKLYKSGEFDSSLIVQAFARHRTTSLAAQGQFKLGDTVSKKKGSQWTGKVVGFYSTKLTPIGCAVESSTEKGSVQIYPETALEHAPSLAAQDGRCRHCDGTGDVHRADGEWLGKCDCMAAQDGLVEALTYLESEARRFAGMYPEASDGRNTFLIFADKIASVSAIKGDKS